MYLLSHVRNKSQIKDQKGLADLFASQGKLNMDVDQKYADMLSNFDVKSTTSRQNPYESVKSSTRSMSQIHTQRATNGQKRQSSFALGGAN